jgi:hypothetical protein
VKTQKLETVFETNPNKDFLRDCEDKTLVERWYQLCGRPLKYLGLPAWEMLDIIAWQNYLGRFTTIEREENQQHLMFLKANVKNFEDRLHSLYGEFDKILIKGRDKYGNAPDWPYDVVNLDYFGGFIYPDLSRPKALKKLIDNQGVYERSFLLIVTQHLRDKDSIGEKASFLEDLRKWLKNGVYESSLHPAIDKVIDWYLSGKIPDAARQALYMNYFFRDSGEAQHFKVKCHAPILYPGTGGAWMIHFTAEFFYQSGIGHRSASDQSLVEVINLGLEELRNGAYIKSRFNQPQLKKA